MNDTSKQAALTIGDAVLRHGLMLAPLAGVSDHPFRRICRAQGAEFTVSEMVSAKSLCYEKKSRRVSVGENSKSAPLAKVWADDVPVAVQLFGSEPEFMAEAAAMVAEGSYAGCTSEARPAAIDINMGCPVHKIVSNGEGSALLRDISLAGRIVRAVTAAVDLPVTVKIRIGFDAEHICAVEMAKEYAPFVRKIEVEVENLDMLKQALEAGADIIMLDNMSVEDMKEAVKLTAGKAETECSGNVTKENIARLVNIGVDYISSGALTHSAPILDLSLKNLHAV